MKITAHGYQGFGKYTNHLPHNGVLELPLNSSVTHALETLNVPFEEQRSVALFVNGRLANLESCLNAQDELVFFPRMEGG